MSKRIVESELLAEEATSSVRINTVLEWFLKNKFVDKRDPKYIVPKKMSQAINIYLSDLTDIEKVYEIHRIYPDIDEITNQFPLFERHSDVEEVSSLLNLGKKIVAFYRDAVDKGMLTSAYELMPLNKDHYFEDFIYAREFVNEYINYNDSPLLTDFLHSAGISRLIFTRFLNIVNALDPDLYDKYVKKEKENRTIRKVTTIQRLEKIRHGIVTGNTPDGEEFDSVEYFKLIPYFDKDTQDEVFADFELQKRATLDQSMRVLLEELEPTCSELMINYIYRNNLGLNGVPTLSEKEIRDTNYIINGRQLTDEDKDTIVGYMRANKIPFISSAFNAVRNKHLAGKLPKVNEAKPVIKAMEA